MKKSFKTNVPACKKFGAFYIEAAHLRRDCLRVCNIEEASKAATRSLRDACTFLAKEKIAILTWRFSDWNKLWTENGTNWEQVRVDVVHLSSASAPVSHRRISPEFVENLLFHSTTVPEIREGSLFCFFWFSPVFLKVWGAALLSEAKCVANLRWECHNTMLKSCYLRAKIRE